MPEKKYTISYPRRRVARGIARTLGRLLLPLAFEIHINGQEHFPKSGPLLVVGNHVAVMEAVLMVVYSPWQVELLGAGDIPHEKVIQIVGDFFGYIPVNRGHFDRSALKQALDVLRQEGVIGVFPEGGIWNAGAMRAQTGVAWLSYRAHAPVIPIGFSGTLGAVGAALRLEKPRLTMNIGRPIPAAEPPPGQARKTYLVQFATQIMDEVKALLPADYREHRPRIIDERFELEVTAHRRDGDPVPIPPDLAIGYPEALAKLLHRPAILKIFTSNLRLPTQALQNLDSEPDVKAIVTAVRSVLSYLTEENPYLLTYRFGPKEAEAMQVSLENLLALARWADESSLWLKLTPIRRYYALDQEKEIVQIKQGAFKRWM